MTFDKFTLKAQETLARAQQQASELNHQQIETEHLLKALLDDSEGVPLAIMKKLGANVGLTLSRLEEALRKLPRVSGARRVWWRNSIIPTLCLSTISPRRMGIPTW